MNDWQLSQGTVDFRNEERRAANRGPQDSPRLFADPPSCTARGCQAGTRINLCDYDARRDQGELVGKRPRGCLNTAQNRDGVPY